MVSKLVPVALVAILVAFGVTTAWAMTVTGIFEPAGIDVPHLEAGAGNDLLRVRSLLVVAASGLAILWALGSERRAARLKRLAVVPSAVLILYLSVAGLDRFAPGYSEEKFLEIQKAHENGQRITQAEVTARLGLPLATAPRPEGQVTWSYTYTPSGGFGWPKRFLTFDSRGALVNVFHFDEP